jgi:hypothetical protein
MTPRLPHDAPPRYALPHRRRPARPTPPLRPPLHLPRDARTTSHEQVRTDVDDVPALHAGRGRRTGGCRATPQQPCSGRFSLPRRSRHRHSVCEPLLFANQL